MAYIFKKTLNLLKTKRKNAFLSALMLACLCVYSPDASAQVKIQYPEYEWQVSLIPEIVGERPAYCVATNRYSDGTFMSFGMMEDGKASMSLKFKRNYFKRGNSYPVLIGFSSGVEGSLSAFSKSPDTLIIQGRENDVIWRQLEEHDMFSYQVDDFTFVYSLDYFTFIRTNLEICLEKINLVEKDPENVNLTKVKPRKRFDLSKVDIFDDVQTGIGFDDRLYDEEPVRSSNPNKIVDRGLYERDYGSQKESVLKEAVNPEQPELEIERSNAIDRIFSTFKDTDVNPKTWTSPDVPELPQNYIESGLERLKHLGGDGFSQDEVISKPIFPKKKKSANLADAIKERPVPNTNNLNRFDVSDEIVYGAVPSAMKSAVKTSLPEMYQVIFELAHLLPSQASDIQSYISDDYVSYSWMLPNGDDVYLEQIMWPSTFSMEYMMDNYVTRAAKDCIVDTSHLSDVFVHKGMDLAEGNYACGKDLATLAFMGANGTFTTFSIQANKAYESRLKSARNRFLMAIIQPEQLQTKELSSDELGTIFPSNTLISSKKMIKNVRGMDHSFLPKSPMLLDGIQADSAPTSIRPTQSVQSKTAPRRNSSAVSIDEYLIK